MSEHGGGSIGQPLRAPRLSLARDVEPETLTFVLAQSDAKAAPPRALPPGIEPPAALNAPDRLDALDVSNATAPLDARWHAVACGHADILTSRLGAAAI